MLSIKLFRKLDSALCSVVERLLTTDLLEIGVALTPVESAPVSVWNDFTLPQEVYDMTHNYSSYPLLVDTQPFTPKKRRAFTPLDINIANPEAPS